MPDERDDMTTDESKSSDEPLREEAASVTDGAQADPDTKPINQIDLADAPAAPDATATEMDEEEAADEIEEIAAEEPVEQELIEQELDEPTPQTMEVIQPTASESVDEGQLDPSSDDEAIDAPDESAEGDDQAAEATPVDDADSRKRWYVVKVQSGREESIKAAVERRVRIERLEHLFGHIVIPVEKITVIKKVTERKKAANGEYTKVTKEKRVVKEQKKFPGYLMAFVEYNNEVLSMFRETSGVGDFVGGSLTRAPLPMTEREVQGMLSGQGPETEEEAGKFAPPTLKFGKGDRVRVRDGIFVGLDGEVKEIVEPKNANETTRVKIELMIFGRPTSVDLEHWQVDPV